MSTAPCTRIAPPTRDRDTNTVRTDAIVSERFRTRLTAVSRTM